MLIRRLHESFFYYKALNIYRERQSPTITTTNLLGWETIFAHLDWPRQIALPFINWSLSTRGSDDSDQLKWVEIFMRFQFEVEGGIRPGVGMYFKVKG